MQAHKDKAMRGRRIAGSHRKRQEAKEDLSPTPLQGARPCQALGFRCPASRGGNENMCKRTSFCLQNFLCQARTLAHLENAGLGEAESGLLLPSAVMPLP